MTPEEMMGMDPKAQMMALAAALRRKQAIQEEQAAELQGDYAQQQGKADQYRSLGLLTSIGSNPLLQGIQRAATAAGDDYQQDARTTTGLLRGTKGGMDPTRLLGLQQGQERIDQSGDREARLAGDASALKTHRNQLLQWQKDKAAGGAAAKAEKDAAKQTADSIKLEGNLRKEVQATPAYKNYQIAAVAYDQVKRAAEDPSGASDIVAVTKFMSSIDPNTGVKDQEFNNAQNSAGLYAKAQAALAQLQRGTRLTPEQRADFVRAAHANLMALKIPYDQTMKHYEGLAGSYKVDPSRVAMKTGIDLTEEPPPRAAPVAPSPRPSSAPAESIREKIDLADGSQLVTYTNGRQAKRTPKKKE